jgi:adenylate cyclase class 2
MASYHHENEIKFNIKDIKGIENRLKKLGASLLHPRTLERNYRFDTKDNRLSANHEVLRLRLDSNQWITYKKNESSKEGVQIRNEIEFSISDLSTAKLLLEAIGFQVFQIYEKYRTVYALNGTEVMLDELPFGSFVEIEGSYIQSIIKTAQDLQLNLDLKIDLSYMEIFAALCQETEQQSNKCLSENKETDAESLKRINILPADR